jgi:hypothetical protein
MWVLMRYSLLLIALGGCRDDSSEAQIETGNPGEEDTYDLDTGEPEESTPWYSAEELGQIIAGLEELGLPHARALRDTYQSLMENGDSSCPGSLTEIENELEGCTAATGWYYGGLLTFVVEELTGDQGELQSNFWTDTCDFQIVDPDGVALIGGGDIEGRWNLNPDGNLISSSVVKGSWIWPDSEHPWLAQGMSTDLAFRLEQDSETGSSLNLWGTLGTQGVDIYMDNLFFAQGECSDEVASGTVWIRQADGTWYELVWAEDCSGCFSVTWDFREELGEGCVDLSGLKAATVAELEIEP